MPAIADDVHFDICWRSHGALCLRPQEVDEPAQYEQGEQNRYDALEIGKHEVQSENPGFVFSVRDGCDHDGAGAQRKDYRRGCVANDGDEPDIAIGQHGNQFVVAFAAAQVIAHKGVEGQYGKDRGQKSSHKPFHGWLLEAMIC